jgi:multidrug efflux system membrane fusion protein
MGRIRAMRRRFQRLYKTTFVVISFIIVLSACKEQVPELVERIRAIKTVTVTERASGQLRKFSGVMEATDKSSLSFEVSGNVQKMLVKVGDKVKKGQVIAVLDKRPFQLNVEASEAALGRAKVQLADKKADMDRYERIRKLDPGAVSQASLDQSKAAYQSAQNQVSYATSQLNLARRDLEKTELRAPFDGVIGEKHVEAFQEVIRGKPIFNIFAEGAMEASIQIPETIIKKVYVGLRGEIRFPTEPDHVYKGAVSEVSSVAGAANAFPVKVALLNPRERVRPGMTAEVSFLFSGADEEVPYLIPISALAPGDDEARAYVFVFDPETSTVKKTPIQGGGVTDNDVVVTKGLKGGDIVAVAGVSFLRDGQKVKLMEK